MTKDTYNAYHKTLETMRVRVCVCVCVCVRACVRACVCVCRFDYIDNVIVYKWTGAVYGCIYIHIILPGCYLHHIVRTSHIAYSWYN